MNARLLTHGLLVAATLAAGASAGVKVSFQHRLSDFTGPLNATHVRLAYDQSRNELYVDDGAVMRIYNASGMEVYQFGYGPDHGLVRGAAILSDGDMVLLSRAGGQDAADFQLLRCDYRGQVRSRIEPSGLPVEFAGFAPDAVFPLPDGLLLVSRMHLLAVAVDLQGRFRSGHDLRAIIEEDPEKRKDLEIGGFAVDGQGRFLFTVPTQFRAYVLSPDGTVGSFGRSGGAPGRFGVAWGIGSDDAGRIYVGDKLRSVVMVFDPSFSLLAEFGGYGDAPGSTVRPGDLVVSREGKVFVTEAARRGVSVYSATESVE